MNTEKAYNQWSATYDQMKNPTRDLDSQVTREMLGKYCFEKVIELGCGTGKNTAFLGERAKQVWSVDFSEKMLEIARSKIKLENVIFLQADVCRPWDFCKAEVDLVTSCLMLEHIEDMNPVFQAAHTALGEGGKFYICELHPIKQYLGSKARFEAGGELVVLDCYVHHLCSYLDCARQNGFELQEVGEWFDEGNREIPRLISLVFNKKQTS